MTTKVLLQTLGQHLFAVPETTVYAILDGASAPDLLPALDRWTVEAVCLFRGELEPDMALMAPYLAVVQPNTPFAEWILQEGWGKHWGIFAISKVGFRELRQHFRSFIKVYGPDGKPLYFRYYDPRVLRAYLPTCNPQEMRTVFGPVLRYIAEDEDPSVLLKFWPESGQVKSERVSLT
jgi:hypothetical protein